MKNVIKKVFLLSGFLIISGNLDVVAERIRVSEDAVNCSMGCNGQGKDVLGFPGREPDCSGWRGINRECYCDCAEKMKEACNPKGAQCSECCGAGCMIDASKDYDTCARHVRCSYSYMKDKSYVDSLVENNFCGRLKK